MPSYIPQDTASLTSLPVVYKRLSPTPVDETSIFSSYADAVKYALGDGSDDRGFGVVAYPGQIISVYENSKVSVYVVQEDKTLKAVGSGVESLTVNTYSQLGAISEPVLGQIVKVTNQEGDYLAGLYIYNGSSFDRIGTSTGNTDEIAGLKSDIETIENDIDSIKRDIYVTDSESNLVLDIYTKSETDTKLSDTLKDYATTESVNNTLEGYATTSDLTTGLSSKVDSSTFETYQSSVESTYATKKALNDGLAGKSDSTHNHDDKYASKSEFDDYKETVANIGTYTIEKTDSVEYSAVYQLYNVNGTNKTAVGPAINIPKDMVVSGGEVVELNDGEVEGLDAGTYIKLTLANSTNDTLYIPAAKLVDTYSGSTYINVEDYTISLDTETLATDLSSKTAFTNKYYTKEAFNTDKEELTNTLKGYADTAAENAKSEAIADIDDKLKGYAKTSDLSGYVSTETYNAKVEELGEAISENASDIETLSSKVDTLETNHGTLSGKVTDLETNHGTLSTTVGELQSSHDTLSSAVESLGTEVVKTIKLGENTYTPENNTVTINLASAINDENSSLIPTVKAVSDAIDSINSGKVSISVGVLPDVAEAKENVIYISGDAGSRKETIKIGESFYELGSDTYATKDPAEAKILDHTGTDVIYAGRDGLMTAADKTKLDNLVHITPDELRLILEN